MKTETNLYLRSLVEKQRADLLNERSCIINRISGSTMSDDEIEDAAFNLSEIGQKIRKFNGFLSDLRQEGHKNELGPQPTPRSLREVNQHHPLSVGIQRRCRQRRSEQIQGHAAYS